MGFWSHLFAASVGASLGFVLLGMMKTSSRAAREEEQHEHFSSHFK